MVVPPGPLLLAVRVAGSVLLVGGAIGFLASAGQVYFHKLAGRGLALSGAYAWIRHPQYLSPALTGLGHAILWPRLLTLVLWTVMVGLYVLLARDEERRMARLPGDGAVLAYAVPVQYVMQGMIADTGPAWRLYQHHQTLAMIVDWIFHPLRHLEGGHAMMHHPGGGAPGAGAITRRIIFLRIPGADGAPGSAAALFAMGAARQPLFFVDVDLHTLEVLAVWELGPGTGGETCPRPCSRGRSSCRARPRCARPPPRRGAPGRRPRRWRG